MCAQSGKRSPFVRVTLELILLAVPAQHDNQYVSVLFMEEGVRTVKVDAAGQPCGRAVVRPGSRAAGRPCTQRLKLGIHCKKTKCCSGGGGGGGGGPAASGSGCPAASGSGCPAAGVRGGGGGSAGRSRQRRARRDRLLRDRPRCRRRRTLLGEETSR